MLNRIFPRIHRFNCPDEHQLTAYVDQQLIGAERERVESHLSRCDSCLEQVGFLVKESADPKESTPSPLVQRAQRLASAPHENARLNWTRLSVAAACAVIAIGLLVWRKARPDTEDHSITATASPSSAPAISPAVKPEADTAVRGASPLDSQPFVLSPQPGAIVRASDFSIRWDPVSSAAAYEVRVVTADGDLVWRKRVHETSVTLPKEVLRPGLKYFVWVRAWLANGQTQQSAAVGFVGG
jgi:anti-sigma factor RsiW